MSKACQKIHLFFTYVTTAGLRILRMESMQESQSDLRMTVGFVPPSCCDSLAGYHREQMIHSPVPSISCRPYWHVVRFQFQRIYLGSIFLMKKLLQRENSFSVPATYTHSPISKSREEIFCGDGQSKMFQPEKSGNLSSQ